MDTTWSTAGSTVRYGVQLGTWTNWSRGPVFGVTLTLSRENGNLLIAFTAFFVGLVSARFWRIVCFVFHWWYSTPGPRDGLHHQRQAILRNSATAESGIWVFWQLYRAWYRSTRRSFVRLLPILCSAVCCVCIFVVASGFSSRISTGVGNEVLLDGRHCGLVDLADHGGADNISKLNISNAYVAKRVSNAENYAQQCYSLQGNVNSGIFDCTSFATGRLPASIDEEAPCPFKSGICRSNTSNLRLDSGYIDSHVHLGVNAPPDERILFRHVYHCAPLNTEGYTSDVTGSATNYTRYYYGSTISGPSENRTISNYTYEAESLSVQYAKRADDIQGTFGKNFLLTSMHSLTIDGVTDVHQSRFIPGLDLERSDADINLVFLVGNGVRFQTIATDDWYRATVPGPSTHSGIINGSLPTYQPEVAASPMGCTGQYQFCNGALPAETRCGPLASFYDAAIQASPLFNLPIDAVSNSTAEDKTASRYLWFVNSIILSATTTWMSLEVLGAKALLSQQTLLNGHQSYLPDGQWKLDAAHWWSAWLASLQTGFVAMATGPQNPDLESMMVFPGDSAQRAVCNAQKVQTTEFASFSVFGLSFIFVAGTLIIAISFALEPLFECLRRQRNYKTYKQFEWKANETLYLQRLGFQGLGRGTWSHCSDVVPVTKPGDLFRALTWSESSVPVGEGDEEKSIQRTITTTTEGAPVSSPLDKQDVAHKMEGK